MPFVPFLEERLRLLPFAVSARQLLDRDAPGGLGEPGLVSANGHCRLIAARDGWVAINLARPEDVELIPAFTQREGPAWSSLAEFAREEAWAEVTSRAIEFQLPVARVGEAEPAALAAAAAAPGGLFRVLDLSALWAGPLCAGLLGRAGAEVVRIESLHRPDPTPAISPRLDGWLNGAKLRITLDLTAATDRERLREEIARCDVLVTSARPAALARLGLDAEVLAVRSGMVWAAITAHGWDQNRVGFGDDCAAAGGLVEWVNGEPRFFGDALGDPLAGLEGALAVLLALHDRRSGRIDLSMARIASAYAQGSAP